MRKLKLFLTVLVLPLSMTLFYGCGDDDGGGPAALTITGIEATGTDLQSGNTVNVDLNAATSAEDVPLDAVIKVTFSRDVDASTATAANFSLGAAPVNVSASGAVVTITPQANLERGTSYTLSIGGGVKAADGGTFTASMRSFTSAGQSDIDPPQAANQVAYFKLDNNGNDAVGSYDADAEIGIIYGEDRFGNINSAAMFDGDASIMEFPNGKNLLTEKFTVSFWVRVDTLNHLNVDGNNAGHFIMGVGAFYGFQMETGGRADFMKMAGRYRRGDGTSGSNDFFVNADGKNRDNGGWIGVEFEADLTASGGLIEVIPQKWIHVVVTYDGTINKRSMYINGMLIETDDLSMPAGTMDFVSLTFDPDTGDTIGDKLAFGFPFDRTTTLWSTTGFGNYSSATANHFKGGLDDVRFFNTALTGAEVTTLYDAEKP